MRWLRRAVTPADIKGKRVLEVGSMDVNGSIRPHAMAFDPEYYLGIDIAPGKGVDKVGSAHQLREYFAAEPFDVVISTEMLEHVEDWRDAVANMKAVLKPGGLLIITTRRPGFPRHCYPHDHWRFTPKVLAAAFQDFQVIRCQAVSGCGVVLKARKPDINAVHPEPAPTKEWRWSVQRLWVLWAYRGRSPVAR